ncbi:DNA cytosine methyltransferase [Desulfobacula phenolica]|uniref:DNA (cytosine-5-)-methyltransferase n=1 Tax=Desulfobacula phenolica TaxID=90732 RepID=A0A1H2J1U1_9BACT|nr:DNA cytosine methyltransferase [Desulfobacula phenolica]SDU50370.1 DNA (cytosine-5)-methyltransferase 1 [Desulfobacula phenolica]
MNNIAVVDLFAGPGGLGEGFSSLRDEYGNSVFKIALSIEMQTDAHKTLLLRSFYRKFSQDKVPSEYYDYLKGKIDTQETLFSLYPEEAGKAKKEAWCAKLGSNGSLNHAVDTRIRKIKEENGDRWILIGGPPCQAYSVIGRSRNKGIKDYIPEKDPKNYLYKEYLRIIAEHLPAVFIMENVTGMLSARLNGESVFEKILSDLRSPLKTLMADGNQNIDSNNDYDIYPLIRPKDGDAAIPDFSNPRDYVIKSENFGIPQRRHRVVLFGVRKKYSSVRPDTLKEKKNTIAVMDVISDLPELRSGLSRNKDSMEKWKNRVLQLERNKWFQEYMKEKGDVQKCMRAALKDIENQDNLETGGQFVHGKRNCKPENSWWYKDERLDGACNHQSRLHMTGDLHRYMYAACFSRCFRVSPKIHEFPKELMPKHKNARTGKFNDRFRVQVSDTPSTTITSHISKDGHYFIHPDPSQCRSFTVREAARLQTFPDNYFFEGSRTQQYIQVGNAVPPLLARQIAEIVYQVIKETKDYGYPDSRKKKLEYVSHKKSRYEA